MWEETFHKSVKYLGVILDECSQKNFHINQQLCLRLNKTNAMLCKICHYVNETPLRSIYILYYTIFQSHLVYFCTAWGQISNVIIELASYKGKQ